MTGWLELLPGCGPGHPPAETVRAPATLRRFLREGTPWRGLQATHGMASGSTLRRRVADRAGIGLLGHAHSMLAGRALSAALNAGLLEDERLGLRHDRLGLVVEGLLRAACVFLAASRLTREC